MESPKLRLCLAVIFSLSAFVFGVAIRAEYGKPLTWDFPLVYLLLGLSIYYLMPIVLRYRHFECIMNGVTRFLLAFLVFAALYEENTWPPHIAVVLFLVFLFAIGPFVSATWIRRQRPDWPVVVGLQTALFTGAVAGLALTPVGWPPGLLPLAGWAGANLIPGEKPAASITRRSINCMVFVYIGSRWGLKVPFSQSLPFILAAFYLPLLWQAVRLWQNPRIDLAPGHRMP